MYYSCKGERRGQGGELCCALVLSAGVVLIALSLAYVEIGRLLFAAALPVLMLGMMLLLRYCFTEYTYTLEDGTLTVTERRGRRIRVCARLHLSDIDSIYAVKKKRFSHPKGNARVYDYRPELISREYAVITLTDPRLCDGRERIIMLISPDEKMLHFLGH